MKQWIGATILILCSAVAGAGEMDGWWKSRSIIQHITFVCPNKTEPRGFVDLDQIELLCGNVMLKADSKADLEIISNTFIWPSE